MNAQENTHQQWLRALVELKSPVRQISAALSSFPFDYEGESVTLHRKDVVTILRLYLEGKLSSQDVEEWGNLVEGRDGIIYEPHHDDVIKNCIQTIANPCLTEPLTIETASNIIRQLS